MQCHGLSVAEWMNTGHVPIVKLYLSPLSTLPDEQIRHPLVLFIKWYLYQQILKRPFHQAYLFRRTERGMTGETGGYHVCLVSQVYEVPFEHVRRYVSE